MANDLKDNRSKLSPSQKSQKQQEAKQKSLHLQIIQARSQLSAGKLSEGIETYFKIATELVLTGKISMATAIYKLILKEESTNPMALAFLSSLYHHQGLEAEAQQLNTPENGKTLNEEAFPVDTVELSKINELEKILSVKRVAKNQEIITQNQENHNLYLIVEGRFQILHQGSDKLSKEIAVLSNGNLFGELTMLLPHRKATATVIALESGKVLTVAREEFRLFLKTRPALLETILTMAHKRLLEHALRPLFISDNDREQLWLSRVVEKFKISKFSAQELLLKEGERNQALYVILDGDLKVSCHGPLASGEIPITTLTTGDFFGEFSLLTGEAASATVRALSNGWVAILKIQEVDRLATHFPEFLPRILNSFRARKQNLLKKKINGLSSRPAPVGHSEGIYD